MNAQNIKSMVMKKSAPGVNSKMMEEKIAQGFVDGDVIDVGGGREIRIEGGIASGYNKGQKENSFDIAKLPVAQQEQLMAQYIVANCGLPPRKVF